MADTLQQLLRERADDDTVGLKYGDRTWTWREHIAEATAQAAALIATAEPGRPLHVAALLGNTPDMLRALAAAGLGGYVLCGINTTRRGAALARDIARVDTQLLLVNAEHRALIDGLDLPGVRVIDVSGPEWATMVAQAPPLAPLRESTPDDTFMMIFTSGTSGEPKAVQVPHAVVLIAGSALVAKYEVGSDDVGYLSMPLFHSNAVYAGWAVTLVSGAAMVPAKFSASRFLADVRRHGVTYMNYVGKPLAYILATAEQPDDHDNTLRVAFGNEASDRDIDEFARRFGCTVWDGFGSTENAIIVIREDGCPPGSLGKGYPGVAIYHPDTVQECDVAEFDENGALLNADAAVGELVNTTGSGLFRGYYNDQSATDERIRHGMYWSGDLAYRDADGLDLLRRPQRGLAAGRRREHGDRTHRAGARPVSVRQPRGRVRGAGRDGRRPDHGGRRAPRRRRVRPRPVREVPVHPRGTVGQGVAAVRLDHRRVADDRDQQDPQTRARRAWPTGGRRDDVEARRHGLPA